MTKLHLIDQREMACLLFQDLEIGTWFMQEGVLFIKTSDGFGDYNAFAPMEGDMGRSTFERCDSVEIVNNVYLTIEN